MESQENKGFYTEKDASPVSSTAEPAATGHVQKLRNRMPGFSLQVRQEPSSFAVSTRASNADFDPIPPSEAEGFKRANSAANVTAAYRYKWCDICDDERANETR